MKIKVDDEVVVVSNEFPVSRYVGRIGTVIRMYEDIVPPMVIVKFADEVTIKVPLMYLEKVAPQEKSSNELLEGAKRISKVEFDSAVFEAIRPDGKVGANPLISALDRLVGYVAGNTVSDKIFGDQEVVTMTEDQFVNALWDGCSPKNMSDCISGAMSLRRCVDVSIASIMSLRNLVKIFFPDESKND